MVDITRILLYVSSMKPIETDVDGPLREYLTNSYSLSRKEIALLLDDVRGYWNRTSSEYIQSRHLSLQREGLRNEEIYKVIQAEMAGQRFAAEPMSLRQIRRTIYG